MQADWGWGELKLGDVTCKEMNFSSFFFFSPPMESTSEPPQAQSWEGEYKAQAAKSQDITRLSELKSRAERLLWTRECGEERAMKELHNSA